jgi:tRNA (guanine-N7-)-methyltransferase
MGESQHRPRAPRPYADAPRLPSGAGGDVDVARLVSGAEYELEIGPGRGGFIFERLAVAPRAAIVGLEVRRKWAAIVDARIAKRGLSARARVFAEDAKEALPHLVPEGVLSRVFLHFPDPWWKKRHEKRLLLTPELLGQIARLLSDGGELFVQTDVAERADEYEARIEASPMFRAAGEDSGTARVLCNPYGAESPREKRAIADGLPIHRLRYLRMPRQRNEAPASGTSRRS